MLLVWWQAGRLTCKKSGCWWYAAGGGDLTGAGSADDLHMFQSYGFHHRHLHHLLQQCFDVLMLDPENWPRTSVVVVVVNLCMMFCIKGRGKSEALSDQAGGPPVFHRNCIVRESGRTSQLLRETSPLSQDEAALPCQHPVTGQAWSCGTLNVTSQSPMLCHCRYFLFNLGIL